MCAPAEIDVTKEMVQAGTYELRQRYFGESLDEIVEAVYRAMELERRDQSGKASASESIASR